MESLTALVQSLGIAYAAGINLYATIAILGLAERFGWVGALPGGLDAAASFWVIGIASFLYLFEFGATLIPGVTSAWETFHSLIRPPAAALLAVVTAWHGDPAVILAAGLLGGLVGITTHTTKLGVRYAADTSPEPLTNGALNVAELGIVSALLLTIWTYPWLAFVVALALLAATLLVKPFVWRVLRQVLSGHWMPGRGLLQGPRATGRQEPMDVEE